MKRIELHWQILIALTLGILYGVFLPPNFKLDNQSFEDMKTDEVSTEIIKQVTVMEGEKFVSRDEFDTRVIEVLGNDLAEEYTEEIYAYTAASNPVSYISWLGTIFMRALKMIIVPLILSSLISGVTNIGNAENLGRLGMKTMGYYLLTSTVAIVTGLFFVNLIKPGVGVTILQPAGQNMVDGMDFARESFDQTLINMVPVNIFEAFSEGQMLSIIFFAIIFGFFITQVNDKSKEFLSTLFNSTFDVMMKITLFIIKFTPLGIFGMVAQTVSENTEHLAELAGSMGKYMGAVLAALAFHVIISLPVIMKLLSKTNPWKHFKIMSSALLTAFSTSSSSATLSLTMESVEHKGGVSNKITSFTLPLGATINMDGTALYECIAAMFIAQAYGIDLSVAEQAIVVVTALLASIGAAGIPMAGLVMISVILTAVGLPLEGVGLILAVDRPLDMFRTATNVWSDSCGAIIIAKSEGETLKV